MSRIGSNIGVVLIAIALICLAAVQSCVPDAKSTATTAKAKPEAPPPADQEISVNLLFRGADESGGNNRQLQFDFYALWGEYKKIAEPVSMTVGTPEPAKLDLGTAKLQIVPKVRGGDKGMYDVTLQDLGGSTIGRWTILESGKQVTMAKRGKGYDINLVSFDPEKRVTGYLVGTTRPGYGKVDPAYGVIFVGKGWSFVEEHTEQDTTKGMSFPEVDIVVLPKAWFDGRNYREALKDLKSGQAVGGGECSTYS
jgi:hypothetical protein